MPLSWTSIKTNKKMNFYVGLSSIILFEAVYNLLLSYIPRLLYSRGTQGDFKQK